MFHYCPLCTEDEEVEEVVRFRSASARYRHLLDDHDKAELAEAIAFTPRDLSSRV